MSTGLVTYDPMVAQKEAQSLRRKLEAAEIRITELEGQLRVEQAKSKAVERGARKLRNALLPVHQGLCMIFGEMDAMGVSGESENSFTPAADPKKSAVWDSWKQKLGGKAGIAIDVLLLHGEMTPQQLRIHLKCGNEYVYKVVTRLSQANLINRREGRISLKEL